MAAGLPDVLSAFFVELRSNVQIPKKTLQEIGNYRLNVSEPDTQGGYSHVSAIRVCAAGNGMVCKLFGLV